MRNYYDEFVNLTTQLCSKEDYSSMKKVRKNNRAMDKLILLKKEMQKSGCQDILLELLHHDHERVRMSAAATCLEWGVHLLEAVSVLRTIMLYSSDSTYRFNAKMILQTQRTE